MIRTSKVAIVFSTLLVLPPLIDFAISDGEGYDIAYIHPEHYENPLYSYLTFFGGFDGKGVTPGLRIEIALFLIISFFYLYAKNNQLILSLIQTIALYSLGFLIAMTPILLKVFNTIAGTNYNYSDTLMSALYLLSTLVILNFLVIVHSLQQKHSND